MKPSVRLAYSILCLVQTVGLAFGDTSMAYASTSSAQSSGQGNVSKLDSFERTVFGETHGDKAEDARLRSLEVSLFGKVKTGSNSERIAAINKALSMSSGNLLMPALAPQMDTSETQAKADTPPPPAPYNDAAEVAQDRAKAELKQAMGFYTKGDMAQAEQSFKRVLTIDSHNADAYYNLGVIAEGRSDFQSALSNYRAALNINPNDADLRNAVTSVQKRLDQSIASERQAREQQALAAKQEAEARQKDNLKQYTSSASAAFKAGNYDKAISDLQIVAQQAPSDADVQYALAQAYRGKGDLNSARSYMGRALSLNPSNQMYKTALAEMDRQIAQGGASNQNNSSNSQSGLPAAAPDYRNGVASDSFGHQTYDDSRGNGNSSGPAGQVVGFSQDDSNSSGPTGQLTPFSGSSDSSSRYPGMQRGFASSGGGFGGLGYGGGGAGFNYSSGGGSRLKRAAIGGLTGAAMGAAMSGMFSSPYQSRGRSTMKGALIGGALGAVTSGLFSRY